MAMASVKYSELPSLPNTKNSQGGCPVLQLFTCTYFLKCLPDDGASIIDPSSPRKT